MAVEGDDAENKPESAASEESDADDEEIDEEDDDDELISLGEFSEIEEGDEDFSLEDEEEQEEEESDAQNDDDTAAAGSSKNAEQLSQPLKNKMQEILTTRLLTDQDFAKMKQLKMEHDAAKLAGIKRRHNEIPTEDSDEGEKTHVDVSAIMTGIKRKDDYDARMESIKVHTTLF
jgi:protein SDA1